MKKFFSEIKKGNFVISECSKCKIVVWPPSDYCNSCLGDVVWKNASRKGKIVEFSKRNDQYFALAEFENKIRIIGTLTKINKEPQLGQPVRLDNCVLSQEGNLIFTFSLE